MMASARNPLRRIAFIGFALAYLSGSAAMGLWPCPDVRGKKRAWSIEKEAVFIERYPSNN
jgi:hypothetical protein